MGFYRFFHQASTNALIGFFLIASLFATPAYSLDTKDSQLFITGFNAYLKKDYPAAIANLSEVLEKYPETSLRDMAILWLSRAHFKAGNQQVAAKYMAQFIKEYPESPLKSTIEDDLAELAAKYQRGEPVAVQQTVRAIAVQPAGTDVPDPVRTAENAVSAQDEVRRVAAERAAKEKLEQERTAAAKAEADRLAMEKLALAKAEAELKTAAAATREQELKMSQSKLLREQAIAEYKAVVDRFPGTEAAVSAVSRLKNLGIDYQPKTGIAVSPRVQPGENSNVLSVEVGEQADLEFSLAAEQQTVEIGKRFAVPFEVINRGNSPDSFILASGLPNDYQTRFVAAASPDLPLEKTPRLLPGERFNGLMQFEMPAMSIDGERKLFPVKVLSAADGSISQSRPLRLLAKAPILRAVIKSDLPQVTPGERIPYRLVLLNVGSSAARDVSLRVTFPPQYEPVDLTATGFKLEGNSTLVISGLQLVPGESREIALTMKLKDSALAHEELFLHVDMINTLLNRTDKFVSASVAVKSVSGVKVQANLEKVVAVPGQTVSVLLVVTNSGNVRDDFVIKPVLADNLNHSFYLDSNRDGVRQSSEPRVTHVGPLAPREVANLILEISSSAAEKDGAAVPLSIMLGSQNDPSRQALANLSLVYSRPVLNLTVAGKGGKIRPGEVSSFELSFVNVGSSMAKMVDVKSSLPDQLELIAAEPVVSSKNNGDYSWRFDELGSGEKRSVRISYRIKPGTAVGTSLALKNILTYQDQVGNNY